MGTRRKESPRWRGRSDTRRCGPPRSTSRKGAPTTSRPSARRRPTARQPVRPGCHVGQVGARVGLRVALTPVLPALHDGRQQSALLLDRAKSHDGRAASSRRCARSAGAAGPRVLLVEDHLLHERARLLPPNSFGQPRQLQPEAPRWALPGEPARDVSACSSPGPPRPRRWAKPPPAPNSASSQPRARARNASSSSENRRSTASSSGLGRCVQHITRVGSPPVARPRVRRRAGM